MRDEIFLALDRFFETSFDQSFGYGQFCDISLFKVGAETAVLQLQHSAEAKLSLKRQPTRMAMIQKLMLKLFCLSLGDFRSGWFGEI